MSTEQKSNEAQGGGSGLNVELGGWISAVIRDVAELPDRTSPSDWPDAMLVTAEELREIIESRAPQYIRAQVAPGVWAYVLRRNDA